MKVATIIQARLGSTRFPDKIVQSILGRTVIEMMLERVKRAQYAGTIIIATTERRQDRIFESIAARAGVNFFQGDENDLVERHYQAGIAYGADVVVKIPSDCPLIDPEVIDKVIGFYLDNHRDLDYVSNLHPATFPDGNDVEVIPIGILRTVWLEARRDFEREHLTPFIWEQPERFRLANIAMPDGKDYSMSHRLTLDYTEDLALIRRIFEELYPVNPQFGCAEIIELMDRKPEIADLNRKLNGVNWYRMHLDELRTIDSEKTKIYEGSNP